MTFQVSREDGLFFRQTLFDQAHRVVIKVGSAVLTGEDGLEEKVIDALARQISFLHATGREVLLVSSGAVAAGRQRIGTPPRSGEPLRIKQALAAVGQGLLMHAYEQAFDRYGMVVAQVLLTHGDLSDRGRYLNVRNTLDTLAGLGCVPIINENDTVSTEELRFGDNDTLSAMITSMVGADMLLLLTDVDCLYTANPAEDPDARPVYTVARIDEQTEAMADHTTSTMGTGGMLSKIRAAKMVAASGASSFIGPGRHPDLLRELFSGKHVGTFFLPATDRISSRKQWIAHVLRPRGFLVLDAGACTALLERGKSLLASGIMEVEGDFPAGAPVHCLDQHHKPLAAGLTNYASSAIRKIKGCQSGEIKSILGFKTSDVVIHRDNLALLEPVYSRGHS